jgi:hypothetical protein
MFYARANVQDAKFCEKVDTTIHDKNFNSIDYAPKAKS